MKIKYEPETPDLTLGMYFFSVVFALGLVYFLKHSLTIEQTRFAIGASFVPGINSAMTVCFILLGGGYLLIKTMYIIGTLFI